MATALAISTSHKLEATEAPVKVYIIAGQKSIKLDADKKVPFKITYLKDKADGLGWMGRVDIPGTLKTLVQVEGKFPYLLDKEGRFAPRDDVWYKGVVTATANQWLNVGCGANANSIGPELGFGHMVGNLHDEPVLLLKASQGNRSLGWDFLPPGSERFEHTEPNAPFVVATVGFNGGEGWEPESSAKTIFNAQMAVGDPDKHPKFAGNVASIDTRPFYRPAEQSPRNQSFHYHGNAETYMLVGEAMGKAMVDLKKE